MFKYSRAITIKLQDMRRILSIVTLLLLNIATYASFRGNATSTFISDQQYLTKVESQFKQRIASVGKQFYSTKGANLSQDETEALQFLYAYMPLADVTDYPTSFYIANIRSSFRTREEMSWGKSVPELLFRHFVLPIRVNNEALDNSRMVFYEELKNRVKGMSMKDAILEVNHWCHEKVTYQPSDARTSSPLATVKTATGRCGEESTFTVAALRAIGIPARQVYTPRWAHTDDNHAWVEAWADGKWHFLGACEPEPVLDLGWFNLPASRGMLMHTRAFGDYEGSEEVMLRTSNFTEINLTYNYAPTAKVDFYVKDEHGKAIENARVDFKIYNYAEFFTAVTKYTDSKGHTSLSAGLGDLIVWVSKDGMYAFKKVSFGKDQSVDFTLESKATAQKETKGNNIETLHLDITPPTGNPQLPFVSEEMHKANQIRFAYEDSVRKAYTSTFPTMKEAEEICPRAAEYIYKSRGNKQTIVNFISSHKDNEDRVIGILSTLSDKDLRDITSDILEDCYNATSDQLSPRVEDEMIIAPFKKYFEKAFNKKESDCFRANPEKLAEWIKKNIRLNPDPKALRIAQTPVGVMKSRMTDERSRDIFYVDVARSLGIEARKDEVTGKVQYKDGNVWKDIKFEQGHSTKQAKTGKLVLSYTPEETLDDPKYYSHFTISRIENGTTQLLNFEEGQADMGNGTTWSNTFKNGYDLDTGTYMLTTGARLANGSVLATNRIFNISEGSTTTLPIEMRHSDTEISVIGNFNSEAIIQKDGKDVSILSQTGRGYFVVGILGVGQEPTNHALHDIEKAKASFEKWGRPVVLLFESESDAKKFNKEEFANLPSTVIFAIDKNGAVRNEIANQMKLRNKKQLPMFIIADTFNRVVFVSQGYTIGLGEQMQNLFNKL